MHAPVGSRISSTMCGVVVAIMVLFLSGSKLGAQEFIRGDCLNDGHVNIADIFYSLATQYIPGTPQPQCVEACDVDADGVFVGYQDAAQLRSRLFFPNPPPIPAPYPDCGSDATEDDLLCDVSTKVCQQ